jgi:hypothetical protein
MVAPKEEGNLDGMKSDLRIPAIKKFVTYAGGKNFFSQQIPTEISTDSFRFRLASAEMDAMAERDEICAYLWRSA